MNIRNFITGLAIFGTVLGTTTLNSCHDTEKEKQMFDDAWKYRDSVFFKDQKVFFDNCDTTLVIPKEAPPVEPFYWKWKNLNDSLNAVKKYKIKQAINLYKPIR